MGGRMDCIYLAKDGDTRCVASSHGYDLWSHFLLPLSALNYIFRAWNF
jgi:hypothetical protein